MAAKVSYTTEQLIQIYEESGHSTKKEILQRTALALFPEIVDADGQPPLLVLKGSGRAFPLDGDYRGNGPWEIPAYMIHSNACFALAIMKDGSYRIN